MSGRFFLFVLVSRANPSADPGGGFPFRGAMIAQAESLP